MHERQSIRDAIVAALATAVDDEFPTAAGARVYKARKNPLRLGDLPAICVYTDDEAIEKSNEAPRELKRIVRVAVDCWVRASENVDDDLDDLALEVETAMDADLSLDRNAFDSMLASTEIGISPDGATPIACAHMVYEVAYHTQQRVADATDDFDTADVVIENHGADDGEDGDNRPHDLVEDIHEG
jgi:hypothetical protein